jgi:hypothetical protein
MSPNLHRTRLFLPEYASCVKCGEYASTTLAYSHGRILCRNCRDTRHQRRLCAICAKLLPTEIHHVASERQIATLTIVVCLNCHALLSLWQQRWDPSWRTDHQPIRFLFTGALDVACLWLQRSPNAAPCRAYLMMLGEALLVALTNECPDMFEELDALGWTVGYMREAHDETGSHS